MPEPVELPVIAECRLDVGGLRRQRDRYAALGAHATAVERARGRLKVRFAATVDLDLLGEAIEIERGCCPFFRMQPDVARRELTISVAEPAQDPALDAVAYALGAIHGSVPPAPA